jgi:beta-lactamase regulating signal transducer with metallopeptidase domain
MERMLNGLIEGLAIAVFAWVLLRLIGRRNSGTRFAVWFCALVGIVVAPFVERSASIAMHSAGAAFTLPESWSFYLFGAWAAISFLGLIRVGAGLWHLRNVRKSCTALQSVDPVLRQTVKDFSGSRCAELCVSEILRVPTAIGFFKPAVVIPAWALHELSSAELHAVVLHELAHLRRWDDWTNLAQKILRALFFFHPAVWWVESRLSLEREMACDDLVLEQTANPRAYAECLVSLAEKNLLQRGLALAQAAVGRLRQTSLRILQILDVRRPKAVGVWQPAPWVVAGFSVVCLASAAHTPKLVAFGNGGVPVSAASSLKDDSFSYAPPIIPASYVPSTNGFTTRAKASMQEPGARVSAKPKAAVYKTKTQGSARIQRSRQNESVKPQISEPPQRAVQMVRTAAVNAPPVVLMQEAVFVIVQDQPVSGAIPVMWHVSVWRFTVLPPATHAAPVVSSKSI